MCRAMPPAGARRKSEREKRETNDSWNHAWPPSLYQCRRTECCCRSVRHTPRRDAQAQIPAATPAATGEGNTVTTADAIRPFQIDIPDEDLADLGRRIAAVRWPSKELVADRSQGVQLPTVQALASYWTTEYDWRTFEAKLNALPQFKTEIDGVDVHFIHVKSPHANALPRDHHARLARLGRRAARGHRPAHRPDRVTVDAPRTRSTSCSRPYPAMPSRLSRPSSAGTPAASRRPGRN